MKYDLLVIGAGSGGLVSAEYSAKLGASVLIIEKEQRLGGDCLHTGCVPSKALLYAAKNGQTYKQALKHVETSIDTIEARSDNDAHLEAQGITVIHGEAEFSSKRSVTVGNQEYQFKKCIIATGSRARSIDIDGNPDLSKVRTNENFFEARSQAKELVIVGGGPIGLEMATAMALLGTKVHLVERSKKLMSFMTEGISELLHTSLHESIIIHTDSRIVSATKTTIELSTQGKKATIPYDEMLVAAGRVPVVPKGLTIAGVEANEYGVDVDTHFRTSNKHIYAVGDVTLKEKFTHTAGESAAIALTHAMYGVNGRKNNIPSTPWATFSLPEVAAVGTYGMALKKSGRNYKTYTMDYSNIDKAVTDSQEGQIILHASAKGDVLGAEIIGDNASEMIGYFSLCIHAGIKLKTLSQVIMPYPTLSLAIKQIAGQQSLESLDKALPLLNTVRKLRK